MARKFPSWIDAYVEYTRFMGCPSLFCEWAAIACVAGALERKVWITTDKGVLYPNTFIVLLGEPGVGKSLQTDTIWKIWNTLCGESFEQHTLCLPSVNHATLIDELKDAERKVIRPKGELVSFNSLLMSVAELGVLLPVYEEAMMANMTHLYDCTVYGQRRRTKDTNFMIENVQLNMLAATTPAHLHNFLPEGAWEQGFLSRTLLIYSGEAKPVPLWGGQKVEDREQLYDDLIHDIREIGALYGKYKWSPEAAKAMSAWHMAEGPPRPNHPKLAHYNTRRTAHLLKLCQIVAASESEEFIITLDHYTKAVGYLLSAEQAMPDIFKAMTSGGDRKIIDETWHFAFQLYASKKEREPVPKHLIIQFLSERCSSFNLERIISVMEQAKILEPIEVNKIGKCYIPRERRYA